MTTQERTRDKIIVFATKQFFTYGYSKISTEELATGLAMSKSTLYKYFPGKDALLEAVIDAFYASQTALIEEIVRDDRTTIPLKIEAFLSRVGSRISVIKGEALDDLKRSMPEAFERLMDLRKKVIMEKLALLFEEGARCGYFRTDIDSGFVMHVCLAAIETMTRPDYLIHSPYSYDTVSRHIFSLLFDGYLPREDGVKSAGGPAKPGKP